MLTSVSSAMLAEFGSTWRVCTEGLGDVMSSFRAALSRGRAYRPLWTVLGSGLTSGLQRAALWAVF